MQVPENMVSSFEELKERGGEVLTPFVLFLQR